METKQAVTCKRFLKEAAGNDSKKKRRCNKAKNSSGTLESKMTILKI
jgi:hypothetical protein